MASEHENLHSEIQRSHLSSFKNTFLKRTMTVVHKCIGFEPRCGKSFRRISFQKTGSMDADNGYVHGRTRWLQEAMEHRCDFPMQWECHCLISTWKNRRENIKYTNLLPTIATFLTGHDCIWQPCDAVWRILPLDGSGWHSTNPRFWKMTKKVMCSDVYIHICLRAEVDCFVRWSCFGLYGTMHDGTKTENSKCFLIHPMWHGKRVKEILWNAWYIDHAANDPFILCNLSKTFMDPN